MTEVDPWTRSSIRPELLFQMIKQSMESSSFYWKSFFGEEREKYVNNYLRGLGILEDGESLDFTYPPKPHPQGGSLFRYFFEKKIRGKWVFVSYGEKNIKSSIHSHNPPARETYHLIKKEGKLKLRLNDTIVEINSENHTVVAEPGVIHQAITVDEPVFLVLVMEGADKIPQDQLHVYV